jgi:uncharacterized membrane protein YcjF (UPF0283 family)
MTSIVFLFTIILCISLGLNAAFIQQEWMRMRNQRAYWERKFAREAKKQHDLDMARDWVNKYRKWDDNDGKH